MRVWTLKEGPAAVLAGGRTAGSRPSLPCRAGSAEGMVGEHLNEATITELGSILECGNMTGQANCRHTEGCGVRSFTEWEGPSGRGCAPLR